jgi:hypothetical protein
MTYHKKIEIVNYLNLFNIKYKYIKKSMFRHILRTPIVYHRLCLRSISSILPTGPTGITGITGPTGITGIRGIQFNRSLNYSLDQKIDQKLDEEIEGHFNNNNENELRNIYNRFSPFKWHNSELLFRAIKEGKSVNMMQCLYNLGHTANNQEISYLAGQYNRTDIIEWLKYNNMLNNRYALHGLSEYNKSNEKNSPTLLENKPNGKILELN